MTFDKPIGASLYAPATRHDLLAIANGEKHPELRSAIFCTEDAILPRELETALANLAHCLARMIARAPLRRFVRVRNPEVLRRVMQLPGAEKLDGFVFPKLNVDNLDDYLNPLAGTNFLAMPTLETREAFEPEDMRRLREALSNHPCRRQILALRIGGNDLLALLGIRRPRNLTIYQTPLGLTIAQLVTIFKPYGFHLTAPVFEHIEQTDILHAEVQQDLAHGLCGKTVIHPSQVPLVESFYKIPAADLEMAERIVGAERAVFLHQGSMCEPATHLAWAQNILRQTEMAEFASARRPPDAGENEA
jgi:citrate lyase beta subunit